MDAALYKKILKTIHKYDMLRSGDRVLIGVSGGPDSIFLLNALNSIKDILDIEISVANLDHGIRGSASAKDSRFVFKKTKELKINYIHRKLKLAKKDLFGKLSIEEVLREKRYIFFKGAAKRLHVNVLATAHTLDDQAETVLMRVIKGSTIKGLVGILPVSGNNGLKIIRPLIEIEKSEILKFLKGERVAYRIDHTNLQERYFRNKIRKKILPYLTKYNPRIRRSLCLMAESLREDREFIEEEKKKKRCINKNGKDVSIKLKDLIIQPKSLQREILRDALIESGAFIKRLTYRHWKDMDEFLKYKRKGHSLDLPGGIAIKRNENNISFIKRGQAWKRH